MCPFGVLVSSTSMQEGYGFAEFEDRRDAEDAVKVTFLTRIILT